MAKSGVHLIPAGLEYDRAIKPLLKDFSAEKAYLLVHDSRNDRGDYSKQEEAVNIFIEELKKIPIEWEEVKIDIYDFDGTFKKLYALINSEVKKNNPVYINVSSAPKILQAALTLAAFLNNRQGPVKLFYVEPKRYYEGELITTVLELLKKDADEQEVLNKLRELAVNIRKHGMAEGEMMIHEFPQFPLADINVVEAEILKVIHEKQRISNIGSDDTQGIGSIKELKMLLDQKLGKETPRSNVKYYMDNLKKLGMIETEMNKKELRIRLTRAGELFAETNNDADR